MPSPSHHQADAAPSPSSSRSSTVAAGLLAVVVGAWLSLGGGGGGGAAVAGTAVRQPGWLYYEFGERREPGGALRGQVLQTSGQGKLHRQVNASFFVSQRLAPPAAVARLLEEAAAAEASFKTDADTIDGEPTFERYVLERGEVAAPRLHAAFAPLRAPLVAFVRRVMGCPRCELCDVLLRRYRPHERRSVPVHRDVNAYATAILTLNAEAFAGGYFIADRADSNTKANAAATAAARAFHLPLDSGDVLVHDHDVLHGVNVTAGERFSVVGWFKDRPGHCASDSNPWVRELAEGGDAEAANTLGDYAMQTGDKAEAAKWFGVAAARGHPAAMVFMGQGVFRERGGAQREAAGFLLQAAELGRRDGMAMLAWALDNGAGVDRDGARALQWRREAARLGHPMAISELEQAGLAIEG